MNLPLVATLVAFFLGIYGLISTSELLLRRELLSSNGLLSWDIIRLHFNSLFNKRLLWFFDQLCSYPQILLILYIRLACSFIMILSFALPKHLFFFSIILFLITNLIVAFRNRYGNDGADQMALIVSAAFCIGVISSNVECLKYSYYFIAFQALLAYTTAGWAKLFSMQWRSGTALKYLISTQTYGHRWLELRIKENTRLPLLMSWVTITFLSCFFIFFIIGGKVLLFGLVGGIFFHLGNAIFMRLHTFIWSFLSTYPALYFVRIDMDTFIASFR